MYDQDTFSLPFTLYTMISTAHSGPHNMRKESHPLYTMHITFRSKTGVPSNRNNHLIITYSIINT